MLLLTVGSAVLYSRAFPSAAVRPLAWVALVPFLVTLRRAGRWEAMLLAWAWAVIAAYGLNDWFPRAIATYYLRSNTVGFAFFLGVSSLTAAPYFMAFAGCYRCLARRPSRGLPVYAAAAWVGAELARAKLFTGDPWALLGYSQVGVHPVVQIADVTGVYGVSFTVAAVNAAFAELWLAARPNGRSIHAALAGCGIAGAIVALVVLYGLVRLHDLTAVRPERSTAIAIVQANLDFGSQWREEFYGRNLDAYARLTAEALRVHRPRLVFWPEGALTFFLVDQPMYRRVIGAVLTPAGAQLVTGGPRTAAASPAVYYNSAFLLSPDGEVVAWYDKEHLLPFAEYFPVSTLDYLRRKFAKVREFTPGPPTRPLPTAAGFAGVIICNEALFPEPAAARVRAGAGYLVNLANDSWVSDSKFGQQVFDMVSLRAIEQRRMLVRASTSGPSAIIDTAGRVLTRSEPFTANVIAGRIESGSTLTPYGRFGDAFAVCCALVALARCVTWRYRST
jgi:apolipoprotein N-acyltransferase